MLLLLPPSEGKTAPTRGAPVDLASLVAAEQLVATRQRVLRALVAVSGGPRQRALEVLGLAPGLTAEVDRDAALYTAPAAPAARIYSGVLYEALGLVTLEPPTRRRAARSVLVVSALWGVVALGDRIPAYRLSMTVDLPGVGPLASAWRPALDSVLPHAAGRGLVVDLRSATYAAAWRPGPLLAARTITVGVLRERDGHRTVVSHQAKHHRGAVARHLLRTSERPRTPAELAECVRARWEVELTAPARVGATWRLELVVRD